MQQCLEARGRGDGYHIGIIVECKYHSQYKVVLLLRDPNIGGYSRIILGGTLRCYDHFVPYSIRLNFSVDLESLMEFVYNAVEIHEKGAVEQDLRHAIQQLRYAT